MSFVNPLLLYGLGFIALPVMLHLLMRAKPKRLLFPALRLIQLRRLQNSRRMRLRHLWLLLLRMLVLGAIVWGVSRPSLPAADYGLNTREVVTLAAIGSLTGAAYWAVLRHWKTQRWPQHMLASRRTTLRGGLGALVALLVGLLVLWPYQQRIAAEITAPIPVASSDLPVAAVFLFDASLSMSYTQEGQNRLEVAKHIADEHLARLPARSRLAIGDSSNDDAILFQADLSAAKSRIESLKIGTLSRPLDVRLRAATRSQEDDRGRTFSAQQNVEESDRSDRFIREVYLFTDLAKSAWSKQPGNTLLDELKRLAWLGVYVIDVGVEQPRNASLTKLKLSHEAATTGGEVIATAALSVVGPDSQEHVVELLMESASGELVKKDQRAIAVTSGTSAEIQFAVTGLNRRIERGQLRLVSSDPLIEDNRLDFAVRVDPAIKVTVIGPSSSDAREVLDALEVLGYPTKFVAQTKVTPESFVGPDVICLINANGSNPEHWQRLSAFVRSGGGMLVCLGTEFGQVNGINTVAYNSEDAQACLPAELIGPLNFRPSRSLDMKDTTHPALKKFDAQGVAAEISTIDIRRYWKVGLRHDNAGVILTYDDPAGTPAVLERVLGTGRTILVTTAFDLRRDWNDLPRASPVHFLMLLDQWMQYLSRRTEAKVNFIAGETAVIPVERDKPLRTYLYRKPSGVQLRGEINEGASEIGITSTDERGQFTVIGDSVPTPFETGFAVNIAPAESDLVRLSTEDLDQLLGEKRYSLAANIEGLQKSVTTGRLGVEVFPMLLALAMLAFCLEHVVANRFYEVDQDPAANGQPA